MSITPTISRRAFVGSTVATTVIGTTGHATAPMLGASQLLHSRFVMGDFEVTTLAAGSGVRDEPQGTFAMNVEPAEFAAVNEENFLSSEKFALGFAPTIVNTGAELVLFDTGLGGDTGPSILPALEDAGYTPDQIDVVVITHMHPDHIGGMMNGGAPTFPNARYVTGQIEYDFWSGMDAGNRVGDMVKANVTPMAEKMSFVAPGDAPVSGITAVEQFGHTPGHMGYMIESGGQSVYIAADLANHYVWSLAYPDWEVRFDADKAGAAAARRKILGMLAADKTAIIGYHLPFPGVGFVSVRGDGFEYTPASYQFAL
ncbi:MAG: MBL fold metallo-hydrolase [Pseudomonadota bacterium]